MSQTFPSLQLVRKTYELLPYLIMSSHCISPYMYSFSVHIHVKISPLESFFVFVLVSTQSLLQYVHCLLPCTLNSNTPLALFGITFFNSSNTLFIPSYSSCSLHSFPQHSTIYMQSSGSFSTLPVSLFKLTLNSHVNLYQKCPTIRAPYNATQNVCT